MSAALPWHEITRRIDARIGDLHRQLETAPPEDVRHLQGQIAGLRYVADMPKNLPHDDQMIGDAAPN